MNAPEGLQPSAADSTALADAVARLEQTRGQVHGMLSERAVFIESLRRASDQLASGRQPTGIETILGVWPEAVPADVSLNFDAIEAAIGRLRDLEAVSRSADPAVAQLIRRRVDAVADDLDPAGSDVAEAVQRVMDHSGPFAALQNLACASSSLPDRDWDAAVSAVREGFGSEVAIAAMRGRLVKQTEPEEHDSTVQQPTRSASASATAGAPDTPLKENAGSASTPNRELHNAEAEDNEPTRDSDSISSASLATTERIDDPVFDRPDYRNDANAVDKDAVESDGVDPNLLIDERWLDSVKADLAAVDTGEIDRTADAWRFLQRGENGLAYHMARPGQQPSPTVVAIWSVSRRLVHPYGALAQAITGLVNEIRPGDLSVEESLLLRAALIRPAVVAPETRVGALLRTLPRSPLHARLENFSLRAASAGERLGGLLSRDFKKVSGDDVRAELVGWLGRVGQRLSYQLDRPLYLKTHWSVRTPENRGKGTAIERWRSQRTLEQLVSRVVRPLVDDGAKVWRQVRAEAERVEQMLEQGGVADTERRLVAEGGALARQFGTRGLVDAGGSGFVPTEISELTAELESRRSGIEAELRDFADSQDSSASRVVARLANESLEDLAVLLDPSHPLWPHEPELIHVLHGDLLKIPSIVTGPDWRPVGSPTEVTERLQRYCLQQPMTWDQAYLAHARLKSDEACDRVTEVAEWVPAHRRRMIQQREEILASAETNLLDDLADTEKLVDEAIRLHLLDEASAAAIRRRYAQVLYEGASVAEIEEFVKVANALKQRLQESRQRRVEDLNRRREALSLPEEKKQHEDKKPSQQADSQALETDSSSVFED